MFAIRCVRVMPIFCFSMWMRIPLPLNLNVCISNDNLIIYVMNVLSASPTVLCVNGPNVWLLIVNVSGVKLNGTWEQTVFAVLL